MKKVGTVIHSCVIHVYDEDTRSFTAVPRVVTEEYFRHKVAECIDVGLRHNPELTGLDQTDVSTEVRDVAFDADKEEWSATVVYDFPHETEPEAR